MNEIETRVLELIGEDIDNPDVFTDDAAGMAQIRDSINDAIEEICMLTGSVRRRYNVLLEAGKNFYRISPTKDRFGWPGDAWLMSQSRKVEQTDFVHLVAENPRWLYMTGPPTQYAPIGFDKLLVVPKPTANDILEIDAIVIPNRYAEGTSRVWLRSVFHDGAAHYAVGEFWASRGDANSAVKHHALYMEKLGFTEIYPMANDRTRGLK